MNKQVVQLPVIITLATLAAMITITEAVCVQAVEKNGYDFPNSGVATVLSPGSFEIDAEDNKDSKDELNIYQKFTAEKKRIETELAMANVNYTLNVRADASEESAKVGYLYKDCGGSILEQKDGWTKIQSGALTGWCSDEFLVFADEAVSMADEVGRWTVRVDSEAVRVRTEADENSDVVTIMSKSDIADFVEIVNSDWVSVDFNGETGYVDSKYVDISFHIDEGETMDQVETRFAIEEQIRKEAEEAARKEAEKEAKRKAAEAAKEAKKNLQPTNTGAVNASADELRLLAALIYCEAGNQSYEGKVAVGAVVMNRVKSPAYPNTMYSVIYASGQFTPARSGRVARVYESGPPESCYQAAAAALNGESPVGNATHFRRNNGHAGIVIGAHVFW